MSISLHDGRTYWIYQPCSLIHRFKHRVLSTIRCILPGSVPLRRLVSLCIIHKAVSAADTAAALHKWGNLIAFSALWLGWTPDDAPHDIWLPTLSPSWWHRSPSPGWGPSYKLAYGFRNEISIAYDIVMLQDLLHTLVHVNPFPQFCRIYIGYS